MAFVRRRGPDRRGTPADLLVVGLGNPGARYAGTRHNVGFEVVERLAERHGSTLRGAPRMPVQVGELRVGPALVVVAEPTTFMNASGEAVAPLVHRYGVEDPARLVVVHDELDLPVGRLKLKVGGGLAGHNGLKSIQAHCHTADFLRLRLGVGRPGPETRGADYVLRKVPASERAVLDRVVATAADAVEELLDVGVERVMERLNGRDLSTEQA